MDEFDQMIVRDFVAENWSKFEAFCEERGVEANDIYVALGGESE